MKTNLNYRNNYREMDNSPPFVKFRQFRGKSVATICFWPVIARAVSNYWRNLKGIGGRSSLRDGKREDWNFLSSFPLPLEAEEEWEKILFPRKFLPLFYYKRTGGRIGISKVSPIMEEKESEIWVRNFIPVIKWKSLSNLNVKVLNIRFLFSYTSFIVS